MRDDTSWFAHWEEELPPPEELMPISQSLITPHLAAAFDISTTTSTINSPSLPPPIPAGSAAPLCQVSDDFDSSAGGAGDETARTLKRPRLVWTPQLHKRFVDAVSHLGIKNAVPKTIMQLMNVDGLTRENVASHLQKYRLYLKRMKGLSGGADVGPPSACDHLFASTPIPAAHHHFDNHPILQFLPGVHHPTATNQFFGASMPPPPPPTGGFSPEFDHRYLTRHQPVHRVAPAAPMMMGRAREFGTGVDEFRPGSPTPRKVLTLFPTREN